MLNEELGYPVRTELGQAIRTRRSSRGHAIYGPYERLQAGRYEVTFRIRLAEAVQIGSDPLCAIVDVALDRGASSPAYDFVFASQLGNDLAYIKLQFQLERSELIEFRVFTAGNVALEILDTPAVLPLTRECRAEMIPPASDVPLLVAHRPFARMLYENGVELARVGSGLQGKLEGITFSAADYDDVNFVDELFWKRAYNFVDGAETCVVDVGMNVGLASLLFSAKPGVREVHAFEPFPETFARGMANLSLNPTLAGRIAAREFGLGDGDQHATFLVANTGGDSGAQATRNVEGGTPISLAIRDAGDVLAPILVAARERGLRRVVKIDCEGAEFAIFRSLSRAALWKEIELLMVEWHRVFPGRTQEELLTPLLEAGFVVVDLSAPSNNGFFYAFRSA